MLARALVIAAIVWPMALGAALWDRVSHADERRSVWSALTYAAASAVCHQQPARSFHTRNVAWPVCARCAGLYVAAPVGALLVGWFRGGRRRRLSLLALAAAPTAVTVLWEWAGGPMPSHALRFATAGPLGAAVLATMVAVTHQVD